MRKREYKIPHIRVSNICSMQQLLLSSGVEVEIPKGAKSSTIFEDFENEE